MHNGISQGQIFPIDESRSPSIYCNWTMKELASQEREAHPSLAGTVTRRTFLGAAVAFGSLYAGTATHRIGVFRSDVTPEPGEPLIWTTPTAQVDSPLWAKGVILESANGRYILCAVDWCALCNATQLQFRNTIAEAAGVDVERVLVQTVHQHTAPYADGAAYALLSQLPKPPLRMSDAFLGRAMSRLSRAVREAVAHMQPFDQIGSGQARVVRVASARRILTPDGKVITRYSTSGKDPDMAALPEGSIDPMIKTIAFAAAGKTLVRLYYYATHPQTFCCDGHAAGDIVSDAREAVEKSEGVPQIYFTGCAGDVTVGKYNTGPAARSGLSQRLEQGMRAASAATRFQPAGTIVSRTASIVLPRPAVLPVKDVEALSQMAAARPSEGDKVYQAAIRLAFANRKEPLVATSLTLGSVRILHLPGEPMLEFQKYAQGLRANDFVAVAGYGDLSPGYLCTDRAWTEGGYEPSASNSAPGTETAVKRAIQQVLRD
jgi:hypothetical protein